MKTKIIATIFLVLLNNISNSQEIENTNYISGEIKVPIIVDQILIEDYFLDDRRDSNTKYKNVSSDLYTQLKNIPIYFYEKQTFRGNYIEEVYDLIKEINVTGSINSETNLGTITVQQKETKNVKAHPMNVCDYNYEYSFNYEYKDLIKESTSITKIRDEDPNWEPLSSTFSKKSSDSEPNSLAIYFNYNDFDENSKKIIKNNLALFEIELIKLPTVKVYNRDNINELIFEHKLSESGLVKEEYIIENNIWKEEIAVIIQPDIKNKIITCKISSKSKELEIKTENYMPSATTIYLENFFYNFINKEVFQQFKLNSSSINN